MKYFRGKNHKKQQIIVSLTTFPARILCASKVIRSMLHQTVRADKVILCLAEEQFPERKLPKEITDIKNHRFQIIWGEDLKPHKKYYYAMKMYPESIIITVDDDIYYPDNLLEKLVESYKKFPHAVSCLRGHTIKIEKDGKFASYAEWHNYKKIIGEPSLLVLPTGVGGVLYPPRIFPQELFDAEAIRKTCLMTDDLWLKWWQLVNKVPCVLVQEDFELAYIEQSQEQALWKTNVDGNQNETNWKNITEFYAKHDRKDYVRICNDLNQEFKKRFVYPKLQFIEELRKEGKEPRIKISVIMPVYNAEKYLRQSIESVVNQTLPEIELICVDDGSEDNSVKIIQKYMRKDARVRLLRQKNSYAGCARNNGLRSARGDYVYFMDADDWLDLTAFERLYALVERSREDMCVFFHYTYNEETGELKKVPHYYSDRKKPFASSVTNFKKDSSYFIYNTVVPWNKIYRREFLTEHAFQFSSLQCANDRSFYFDTVSKAETVMIFNAFLLYYRIGNPKSISSLGRLKNFEPHFRSMEEILARCADVPKSEYNMLIDVCMKDIWSYFNKATGALKVEIWRKIEKYFVGLDIPYSENKTEKNYFYWYRDYKEIGNPVEPKEQVIFSVTAEPGNISRVAECIESLLMQSLHAEKTILWLPRELFPEGENGLPEELTELTGEYFLIRLTESYGPYTNVIAAMQEYPEAVIIAADGNMLYDFGMGRRLYDSYLLDGHSIHAQMTDRLFAWEDTYKSFVLNQNVNGASFLNRPVTDCGVLYPKHCLHQDVKDSRLYKSFGIGYGDMWLWCMAGRNGYRVRKACRIKEKRYAGGYIERISDRFAEERDIDKLIKLAEKYPEWGNNLLKEEQSDKAKFDYAGLLHNEIMYLRKDICRQKDTFENTLLAITGLKAVESAHRKGNNAARKAYLKKWLCSAYGLQINFADPVTYTDKLQWMKLYDCGKIKTKLTDKYRVRKWITSVLGEEYLIPLLGVYKKFDDIDFSKLPKSFLLKCSHGTGWEMNVADKDILEYSSVRKTLGEWMNSNFAQKAGLELQYARIRPRILIEESISVSEEWQFMCFDGKVELILADRHENGEISRFLFDRDWNSLCFAFNYPSALGVAEKPALAEKMIELAERCAVGFPFIRVDLTITLQNEIKFRSVSFTPGMGIGLFVPKFYDYFYGEKIPLPSAQKCKN